MSRKFSQLNWRIVIVTRRFLVAGIAGGLGAILIGMWGAQPQITDILANQAKLKVQKQELAKVERKMQELKQVRLLPEFAQAQKLEAVLPSHKPLFELMTSMGQVAVSNQIIINTFSVKPGSIATPGATVAATGRKSKEAYDSLDLNLTISGLLANVQKFMIQVEQISPITTITQLSLTRQEKKKTSTTENTNSATASESAVMAQATLTLSTHYFTQTPKAVIDAPLPNVGSKEKQIFKIIQSFSNSEYVPQTEIRDGGSLDLFGIKGFDQEKYEELLKQIQTLQASQSGSRSTTPASPSAILPANSAF